MFIDFTNTDFENGRNINKPKLKKLLTYTTSKKDTTSRFT